MDDSLQAARLAGRLRDARLAPALREHLRHAFPAPSLLFELTELPGWESLFTGGETRLSLLQRWSRAAATSSALADRAACAAVQQWLRAHLAASRLHLYGEVPYPSLLRALKRPVSTED